MDAPFLTLSFCGRGSARSRFLDLAKALVAEEYSFDSWSVVSDDKVEPIPVGSADSADQIERASRADVSLAIEASVEASTSGVISRGLLSYADYSGLNPEDRNVSLSFSAPEFVHIPDARRARAIGQPATDLFTRLCDRVLPLYASITIDYELETPAHLFKDARSYAFRDFYVSYTVVGDYRAALLSLVRDSLVEPLASGLYVSGSGYLNRESKDLGLNASEVSGRVARFLVERMRAIGIHHGD